ncbi:inositol monophosphatase family protein [Demequina activiva]|uniref:Histidinol-phosphatase n=1 Tax=Demequina activiva TaxID=1582364 RepID=A0A919Q3J9_9MICO|nr:inositol monophosphatase family protein [Demequina activiva]GIG55414.1 histidinol-phosphatase [Demequina activiva]
MQPRGEYADDLALAMKIADDVDRLTLANFASDRLTIELKADDTPVTAVDREAELMIRRYLDSERPDDAVYGEEFGSKGGGPRQWVLDPIDGTKNYIRSVSVWGTLIALLDDGDPVMGVVSAPALGARWFAARGDGAWIGTSMRKARPIGVSTVTDMAEASLSYSSLSGWEERDMLEPFLDLTRSVWRTRAYGDFLSYMMVAQGLVDIACEPELELYDMAALVPIVEEAGGHFTSLSGTPGPFGGDALATNGALHLPVADILNRR